MKIVPKEKPRIIHFREWTSFKLVQIAQWIYPESDAVKAFHLQLMYDQMVYGGSVVCINPLDTES